MNEVIKVNNIDLIYRSAESLSVKKMFKNFFTGKKNNILSSYKALNNVSFSFEKGKVYGIIGNNGAGKSTLLRVLSGVMSPNSGSVERNYKTINLLALGIGFSKELTGIENIFLNGMLLGFSRKYIENVKDEIIAFSEIGDFIYRPMKTYSSGMVSRLAFAIAINLKPEVLLIDEVLSVGDSKFRLKSFEAIREIINDKNITVAIVSHGMDTIRQLCDNVIWLEKGQIVAKGETGEVLSIYDDYNKGLITIEEIKEKNKDSIDILSEKNEVKIDIKDYYLRINNANKIGFNNKTYDFVKTYSINGTNLKITNRLLKNGDVFLYFEGTNSKKNLINIAIDDIKDVYEFENLYKKPKYDNRYGENKLTGINSYIDLKTGSLLLTKIYYYKTMINKYDENNESKVLSLICEDNDINIFDNCISINLKSDCPEFCFSIVLSKKKLFNSIENLNRYEEYYFESLYNNAVWCSFFMRPSGTYTKLPYSIEPFTKDGYGYSLHHSSRKDMFSFYKQTNERFFSDMMENAILQAFLYQKNENYVFFTPYTSTWLKDDTGITAPYIDTRLNETFTNMMEDFLPYSSLKELIDPLKNYIDFLYNKFLERKEIYLLNEGVFFPDYFKENLNKLTHASLNHQLGTSTLFYKAYKQYKDEKYLYVFRSIIKFIENTNAKWINNETGDLYYGLKLENNEYSFYGKDYVYVTLIDLLNVQSNYIDVEGKENFTLKQLTKKKIDYLKTTKYNIFNDDSENAPGEGINSRIQVLKLLNKVYNTEDF